MFMVSFRSDFKILSELLLIQAGCSQELEVLHHNEQGNYSCGSTSFLPFGEINCGLILDGASHSHLHRWRQTL